MLCRRKAKGSETAITIAFLKYGHPWLAFWTVAFKSMRPIILLVLAWLGLGLLPADPSDALVRSLTTAAYNEAKSAAGEPPAKTGATRT
jgi:hypothetical protein